MDFNHFLVNFMEADTQRDLRGIAVIGKLIHFQAKRDGIENRKVVSKKHRKTGLKGRLHFIINWKCRCI